MVMTLRSVVITLALYRYNACTLSLWRLRGGLGADMDGQRTKRETWQGELEQETLPLQAC